MTLEVQLDALTKALDKNTTALEAILAKAPSGATPAGAPKADAGKSADAGKANAPGQTKAPGGAATGKGGKTKAASEDDLRNAFGSYLSVKDKAERETRKGNVKAILDHFGVAKATELPKENWADAIAYVAVFEAGETPNFMNEDASGEDAGDGESLI